MITTRTSDLLRQMAYKLQAVSDALYDSKRIARSQEVAGIASMLSQSAGLLEGEINAYSAEMLKEEASHDNR